MTHPLPDDIQVMVAGYVLGDLSAEERDQFQQLLADHPELAQDISELQETLALLPYGSPLERPDQQLRSRLLLTAEQQLSPRALEQLSSHIPGQHPSTATAPPPKHPIEPAQLSSFARSSPQPTSSDPPQQQRPSFLGRWPRFSPLAALMTVVLGGCSVFLVHRVNRLQTQLTMAKTVAENVMDVAINDGITQPSASETFRAGESKADPTVTIHSASGLLAQQWSGLEHIIQDHVGSLRRSQGPVDIIATDPIRLRNQLRNHQDGHGPDSQLPVLSIPQATLLGGSPCKFDQTKGLRVTYAMENFSAAGATPPILPQPSAPASSVPNSATLDSFTSDSAASDSSTSDAAWTDQQPISLYQIDLKNDLEGNQFPKFSDTYITVNYDGVNLVLWRQDDYLYALVSDLPLANLHVLTQMMELI